MIASSACAALLTFAAAAMPTPQDEREEDFGAVVAPAVLPAASMSTYGYVGIPEVAAGYRYGWGVAEFEARVRADWRNVALAGEALLKLSVFERNGLEIAPYIGVGVAGDAGATYLSPDNFGYVAIRGVVGMNVTYRITDTIYLLGALELTMDFALTPGGGFHGTPLLGPGAEFFLSPDLSISLTGLVGPDIYKPGALRPVGTQFGYGLRLGLGVRLL